MAMMQPLTYGLIVRCPDCGTRFRRGVFLQTELHVDEAKAMLLTYEDRDVDCPSCNKTHTYKMKDIAEIEHIPKD